MGAKIWKRRHILNHLANFASMETIFKLERPFRLTHSLKQESFCCDRRGLAGNSGSKSRSEKSETEKSDPQYPKMLAKATQSP
jgi:hypothetical protein